MRIASNGYVGIGTTNPAALTEIYSAVSKDFRALKLTNNFPTALNNMVGIDFALTRDVGGTLPSTNPAGADEDKSQRQRRHRDVGAPN